MNFLAIRFMQLHILTKFLFAANYFSTPNSPFTKNGKYSFMPATYPKINFMFSVLVDIIDIHMLIIRYPNFFNLIIFSVQSNSL